MKLGRGCSLSTSDRWEMESFTCKSGDLRNAYFCLNYRFKPCLINPTCVQPFHRKLRKCKNPMEAMSVEHFPMEYATIYQLLKWYSIRKCDFFPVGNFLQAPEPSVSILDNFPLSTYTN